MTKISEMKQEDRLKLASALLQIATLAPTALMLLQQTVLLGEMSAKLGYMLLEPEIKSIEVINKFVAHVLENANE